MIAIDTSAIMAIIFREPEAAAFLDCVLENQTILIGLPTILELHLVGEGRTVRSAASDAMAFVNDPRFRRVAFDDAHLVVAIDAFDRYGKGRHPARLNFGDCMAYAVAAVAGIPLLYKGDDFARTDIRPAR